MRIISMWINLFFNLMQNTYTVMTTLLNKEDIIANICIKKYESFSRCGKPQKGKEWTVLAGVVIETTEKTSPNFNVVSIGSGTKCLGPSKVSADGKMIKDGHAEMLARRGLVRFIFNELMLVYKDENSNIFEYNKLSGKCCLKRDILFHLYVSQTPCGDASIVQEGTNTRKRKVVDDSDTDVKLPKYNDNRTGSKPVPGEACDPKTSGQYHTTNVLRNKPGRGEFSQCMSCSDKIMKWNAIGFQGALLSYFLSEPLFFSTIIIGGNSYNEKVVNRAFNTRLINMPFSSHNKTLNVKHTNMVFNEECRNVEKNCENPRACGSAISWTDVQNSPLQVIAANGHLLGMTKKHLKTSNKFCKVSSKNFFENFKELISIVPDLTRENINYIANTSTYHETKIQAPYAKDNVKFKSKFSNWFTHARDLDNFK